MAFDSDSFELGGDAELLAAKLRNAKDALDQAEANLGASDSDHTKGVWETRVNQRKEAVAELERQMEDLSAGV